MHAGPSFDNGGEVTMGVVATGESYRTVSVDWPWTRVLNHFATKIILCGTTRASAHPFWHAGPTVVAKGGKATLRSAQPL